ncbi:MAG: cytochrome C554 [Calditrichaeota bacterium]|nr:cytochrome C554 [Calditrichota bacterium]
MKRIWLILFALLFTVSVFAQEEAEDEADDGTVKYVGVTGCKKCHKTTKQGEQFRIWEESAHAKAFETLKGAEAQKIAKEKGLTVAAHEAPECLKCHITEFNVDDAMLSARFDKQMGVQCESCHGAGSMYKKKTVMKDRAKAIEAGMKDISVKAGTAEKQCVTCHNSESPTFKEFNFDEMWKKIAHPVPAG